MAATIVKAGQRAPLNVLGMPLRMLCEAKETGGAWSLLAAITLQAALGILTLLHQVPIDLALAHQATAMVVLALAVLQTERLVAGQVGHRQQLVAPLGQPS